MAFHGQTLGVDDGFFGLLRRSFEPALDRPPHVFETVRDLLQRNWLQIPVDVPGFLIQVRNLPDFRLVGYASGNFRSKQIRPLQENDGDLRRKQQMGV